MVTASRDDGDQLALDLLKQLRREEREQGDEHFRIDALPAAKRILKANQLIKRKVLREIASTLANFGARAQKQNKSTSGLMNLCHRGDFPTAEVMLASRLLTSGAGLDVEEFAQITELSSALPAMSTWNYPHIPALVAALEKQLATQEITPRLAKAVERLTRSFDWIANAPERKLSERLARLLADRSSFPLERGEAWSDAALADLEGRPAAKQEAWRSLLQHCGHASGSEPSSAWSAKANMLVDGVGQDEFRQCVLRWFPLVDKPRSNALAFHIGHQPDPNLRIIEPHAEILRGLVWCCGAKEVQENARSLCALAVSAYRKIPGLGPRAVRIGNACIVALGLMPGREGLYQLAILKARVKFGTAQKLIDKALTSAAAREGLLREDIEELAIPACGLTDVGILRAQFGEHSCELRLTESLSTEMTWRSSGGKVRKSLPAAVRQNFASEFAELKETAKDLKRIVSAQRDRLDQLFLARREWPLRIWRERYLDHPIVGFQARRLIWSFKTGSQESDGIYWRGEIVDLRGQSIPKLCDNTKVQLWHPIRHDVESIQGWRRLVEAREIRQPFKQAHREIYLLTDAERGTGTYSNRFAAHILRQHQFNALCAARGWKNKLRLMVDDEYPPAFRLLPAWDLRAEYWVEGAGDEYGRDTNETGTYHLISTDQVRFYPLVATHRHAHAGGGGYQPHRDGGADNPLPLDQIPPLVFSEIMRDVDLFVGVASLGNDPNWADGGREGRYAGYWAGYAFGELSNMAESRKAILERLLPRLRIADNCKLMDRFLRVRGKIREYKIHLGSANILMEPNDQYLCIVPGRSDRGRDRVYLPFEGDATLAVILSKAFLLADDNLIKDPSITSQIRRN